MPSANTARSLTAMSLLGLGVIHELKQKKNILRSVWGGREKTKRGRGCRRQQCWVPPRCARVSHTVSASLSESACARACVLSRGLFRSRSSRVHCTRGRARWCPPVRGGATPPRSRGSFDGFYCRETRRSASSGVRRSGRRTRRGSRQTSGRSRRRTRSRPSTTSLAPARATCCTQSTVRGRSASSRLTS
jgi:hypothetical protein